MEFSRFNRNYELLIELSTGEIVTIKPPFTIEFDITRNLLTSANVCSVRIMNLGETLRNLIRKNSRDLKDYRQIELRAGYGTKLSRIFRGNYTQAFSSKETSTWITSIECFDGGFALNNAFTNKTFAKGTSTQEITESLIEDLKPYGVDPGVVGNIEGQNQRGTSYSGNTSDILKEVTDGNFFVDNGRAHVLGDKEALKGGLLLINSSSGLKGSPMLEGTQVHFDMIFEPRILIGQVIELKSSSVKNFNGTYRVAALKHRGTISGTVAGDATTSVTVQFGIQGWSIFGK